MRFQGLFVSLAGKDLFQKPHFQYICVFHLFLNTCPTHWLKLMSLHCFNTYKNKYYGVVNNDFYFRFAPFRTLFAGFDSAPTWQKQCRPRWSALFLVRAKGIEPSSKAWEAFVLPLYHARKCVLILYFYFHFVQNKKIL